ncbi:MAG: S1 RNA-binding domain-containing protein, partial [Acutalibacteraceae bacterium]|nr:S1 RNA-binding domain-containing protein [Acutalibacteraceae bacterium]
MQETKLEVGAIFEGKVTGITKFGAFVDIGGKTGMVH